MTAPTAAIQRLHLTEIGPCASCTGWTLRYGPHGHPLCTHCRQETQ